MIVRTLKTGKFEAIKNLLIKDAHRHPLEASYSIGMNVSGREYILKLQPESKQRLVILQALAIECDSVQGQIHTLVTNNKILSSLLELWLWQGTEQD